MSFIDQVIAKIVNIQTALPPKFCPKCKQDMRLLRWFSCWSCEDCDIMLDFTKNECSLVNKYEKDHGLHKTGSRRRLRGRGK
jgi:predicted amidophosphoribosyltransferase